MVGVVETLPGAVHLLVSLGLAAVLFYLAPGRRANRVFALLLVLSGLQDILGLATEVTEDPVTAALASSLAPYPSIALTFVLAYFVAIYPTPRRWLPRGWRGPSVFLVAALLFLVPYALDHALWIDTSTPSDIWFGYAPGPIWYAIEALDRLVVPGAVFLLARDYLEEPQGAHGSSPLLISLGLSLSPLFFAPRSLAAQGGMGLPVHPMTLLVPLTQALLIGGAVAWVTARGLRSRDDDVRRTMGRYGAVCITVSLLGVVLGAAGVGTPAIWPILSVLSLVMPILVAYALVRHQIFGVELRAKWAVRQGTVVGAFAVTYLVASQMSQRFLTDGASLGVGLAAAAALALILPSLVRAAEDLSDRLFPGVERSPAYLDAQRLDMYRVALEEGMDERGQPRPGAQARWARLRRRLGIDQRDHAILTHTLRRVRIGASGSTELVPGSKLLGRYRIVERLGKSPVARTVLVEEEATGRRLVVKGLVPLQASREMILREARLLRAVEHDRVVHLEEILQTGGLVLLVMEHVEGGSLAERLEQGPLGPAALRTVALDLLDALEAVHRAGLVHRDVKPSNILLTSQGRAKLADFGIVHAPSEKTTISALAGGGALGTVAYMSPEQAREHEVDARSDLYAAAVTLYEACTGQRYVRPRPAESAFELQVRVAATTGFDRHLDPPALEAWFQRALAPEPDDRFEDAGQMRAALEAAFARPTSS